jgi:hypothetical protein
MIDART